jgi:hypothetical protein
MDVRRLLTVKAVEEYPVGAWNIGNRGHGHSPSCRGQERARCAAQYT